MPRSPSSWLPVLLAAGLSAAAAAPGDIYQRTTPDGILEITNVPSGEGYELLLVVPQRSAPVPASRPAPRPVAPLAAVALASPGATVAEARLDPDQLLDAEPPGAGPASAEALAPQSAPAAAPGPSPAAAVAPSRPNTPSAEAFAARLSRYRDSTVSRSTDLVMR